MLKYYENRTPIILSPEERSTIGTWVWRRGLPLRLAQHDKIVQMAADSMQSQEMLATRVSPDHRSSFGGNAFCVFALWG